MNETGTNEQQLRSEIEDLKRQLAKTRNAAHEQKPKAPTSRTALAVVLLLVCLVVAGYYLGYLRGQRRELALAAETKTDSEALPVVEVAPVKRSSNTSSLVLPGN